MPTPEQLARQNIDRMLEAAGWGIQDMKALNPGAALGIAIREYPADSGPADYALLIDRKPVGIIEAKKEAVILSAVETQAARYATSALRYSVQNGILPFVFESTGVETRFSDNRDPKPRARNIFSFPRPETLKDRLEIPDTFRKRLEAMPALDPSGLRTCQFNAITRLEESLANNRPKALVQMATGSGKTFTAITSVYRLLKHAKAKRILFLVDTKNLGEQTEQEFQMFKPNDDNRKFTELYSVQRLASNSIGGDIIQIVREEFGEGNEFCKKVTCNPSNEDDPKSVLQYFRNEFYPRVAVTVDMIATGTDVRPLEVLVFMRDVKSRNYFEQMKGRGTRIQDLENLRKVSPSATTDKTHFVIVDAVGVCKSVKTDSRPLERKRDVPLKDLMLHVVMGK